MKTVTVVPASPGFNVVEFIYDEDFPSESRPMFTPVIAWEVRSIPKRQKPGQPIHDETCAFTYPITPEGREDDSYVAYPDGTVSCYTGRWDSLEDWRKSMIADEERKLKAEKKPEEKQETYAEKLRRLEQAK